VSNCTRILRDFRCSRHTDGFFASLCALVTVFRSFYADEEYHSADEALFRRLEFLGQTTTAAVRGALREIPKNQNLKLSTSLIRGFQLYVFPSTSEQDA
jgi:hypothetical protein